MATLDKLAIRGIRSFDDKGVNIIQFFTPLTVIVGYNGSGKTTIIECLKYATTGDMPPNTKGGAFVQDPKLATSSEVKAQVRLRFFNTNKVRMNCVRNLQVTVKKGGGLTLKTLEGLLQIDDVEVAKNKRAVISTKCAELDEEMPRLLGVSRSILENVIFCHQEESNWPLSEASVLKRRFDDIFDATRYTKALDNIKTIRKDRIQELKVLNVQLDALKTDRDRSIALKEKRSKLMGSLTGKQTRLDELDELIRHLTKENKTFYDSAVKFREIVSRAELLEEKKKSKGEERERVRLSMTESDEADQELQARQDSFQDHLGKQARRKAEYQRKIDSRKEELCQVEERYNRKLSERGALENDRMHHEEVIARQEEEIRSMSLELGIKGFDIAEPSQAQISDFTKRILDAVCQGEEELQSLKKASLIRGDDLSTHYQELRTEKSSKVSSRETVADNSKRIKDKVKQSQDEFDSVIATEADLVGLREAHVQDVAKVESLRRELEEVDYDGQIRKKNIEIRNADDRREEMTIELNTLNRQAESRAKLDMKKKEGDQRSKAAKALLEHHLAACCKVTGRQATVDTFNQELFVASTTKDLEMATAVKNESEKTRIVQHLESTLSISRGQLKEQKDQLAALEAEITAYLDKEEEADTVQQALNQAEEQLSYAEDELNNSAAAHDFFLNVEKMGLNQHKCFGCDRGLKQDDMTGFEKYVRLQITRLGSEGQAELRAQVEDWKGVVARAKSMQPKEEAGKVIKTTTIPRLEIRIDEQARELGEKSKLAEAASSALRAVREEQDEIARLKRVVADASRLLKEAETLEAEVAALEGDLVRTGSIQTGDQVQASINELTDDLKSLKRDLQKVERNREMKRNEYNAAERASFRSERAVSEKEQEVRRREALQRRIDELKQEYAEAIDQLEKLDEAIRGYDAPIEKAKEELERVRLDNAQEEERLSNRVETYQRKLRTLQDCQLQIQRYIDQRGAQKLADCVDVIRDLQRHTQEINNSVKEIELDIVKIEKEVHESSATERNIRDNLTYRLHGRELLQIEDELDKLDLDTASKNRRDFESKYHVQNQEVNRLNGESQHLSGEIASLQEQLNARDEELREGYKDVARRFSQKLVEVKTSEIANCDLEKYAKALDAAIIRFHGLKMQEINEQIKYLWAKTYQGTDIDSISIESDGEKVGNRSYNYRVCMMKDTVKMDMRGRCSAGQKVLASIIIRLALADSFATNCRFMALDEPTLCLDQETVEALARSLGDIIKERPSTQLLVVTHDPQFQIFTNHFSSMPVNLLAQSTSIDHYWRVSRDTSMKSIIERERIR